AMSQEACDAYYHDLKRDGLLVVDSLHVARVPTSKAHRVPITEIAEQTTGRAITANMVALGILAGLTGVVSREALEAAVTERAPHGTADINLQALAAGYDVAERLKSEQ
ncbi:MAG: 2-oxoacid:ferredoxin oxidoreductase subunit gamma, partial [Chloroflexi bacterium]|nr:2-oxoacid:ferredoxin oxidoreductase subunit gamma [Chloroflexota bacterium]